MIKNNDNLEKMNKKESDESVSLEDIVVQDNKPKKEKKGVRFSETNEVCSYI